MTKILVLITLLSLTSCFKTAEEIRREKEIDQQLTQSNQTIASLNEQIAQLKMAITSTSGKLEEINYSQNQEESETQKTLVANLLQINEQLKVLMEENKLQKEQISALSKELESQKEFIKKVTSTLKGINSSGGSSSRSKGSLLKQAHKAFEKNKQKEARDLYNRVLAEEKINNAQKNHVYFNLGLLDYWNKRYDEALVYFSKIYTKYPRSSLSPRALLYIARSFKKSKKLEEAKATYSEVMSNYPKSKQATYAKKELSEL